MPANETVSRPRPSTSTGPDPDAERRGLRRVLYLCLAGSLMGAWFNPIVGGVCALISLSGLACSCHPVR